MHQDIIKRASELINSKTGYIGDGMEGWAVLSLTDENGYPTSATMSISKADGIHWLTFLTDANGVKAKRIAMSDKACVCLASSEYHISLVGRVEIFTDEKNKKENWQEVITNHYGADFTDPDWAVLRFTTESYNLFFACDDTEAKGELKPPSKKANLTITPALGFRGNCTEAIALYEKAFDATLVTKMLYSDADAEDFICKEEEKDFIFYAEMVIGNQLISLGDDTNSTLGDTKFGVASPTSLLIEFETIEALKAAYALLSDGANIITPMSDDGTTYCDAYVSLVDKFGIHWDLMSGYAG